MCSEKTTISSEKIRNNYLFEFFSKNSIYLMNSMNFVNVFNSLKNVLYEPNICTKVVTKESLLYSFKSFSFFFSPIFKSLLKYRCLKRQQWLTRGLRMT